MKQTHMTVEFLSQRCPGLEFEIIPMSTTGDDRLAWSLEKAGGKGLFTSALEEAILVGEADLAVHSAKDLPTEMPAGITLAGYLPRANPRDRLILRAEVQEPLKIATSSPRRRVQLAKRFPAASWVEIRGNVGTRMDKLCNGAADATVMAVAGHDRLDIHEWTGLRFEDLEFVSCVPAAGQGAIGLQVRDEDFDLFAPVLCHATRDAVNLERAVLRAMGGGCHAAIGVHCDGKIVHFFSEDSGYQQAASPEFGAVSIDDLAVQLLQKFNQ